MTGSPSLPFDCVVGYHMNPLTCGVAKFNEILGTRLSIPVLNVFDGRVLEHRSPLFSIKCSEFSSHDLSLLESLFARLPDHIEPYVFLHGFDNSLTELEILKRSTVVYCGNRQIYDEVSPLVPRSALLWSPSTIRPSGPSREAGEVRLFSFGMAHKLRASHYLKLRDLLDGSGKTYSISVSTALHEGTSFEDAFSVAFNQLHAVFGDRIRFQGFLSDDAVLDQLKQATFFVAFFEFGARDNNSSIIAAMEQGCVVLTNLDAASPTFLQHGETVLDIQSLSSLPLDEQLLARISRNAREAVRDRSWDQLIERLNPA